MRAITVVDYDPTWPMVFEQLRTRIWPAVSDLATSIEHVGSTSVEGLPAKPVIDMTVVVSAKAHLPLVIDRLARLGYQHRGDLGVSGREAFSSPSETPAHHLYTCIEGNLGLRNHLAVRDYLRKHQSVALAYGALKKRLAAQFPHDSDGYVEGKTSFILDVLAEADFTEAELDEIRTINSTTEDSR